MAGVHYGAVFMICGALALLILGTSTPHWIDHSIKVGDTTVKSYFGLWKECSDTTTSSSAIVSPPSSSSSSPTPKTKPTSLPFSFRFLSSFSSFSSSSSSSSSPLSSLFTPRTPLFSSISRSSLAQHAPLTSLSSTSTACSSYREDELDDDFRVVRAFAVIAIIMCGFGLISQVVAHSKQHRQAAGTAVLLVVLGAVSGLIAMALFAHKFKDREHDMDWSFGLFTTGWVVALLAAGVQFVANKPLIEGYTR